jgi:predicted ATP-grasp superfamily ATP-dependent carboligase
MSETHVALTSFSRWSRFSTELPDPTVDFADYGASALALVAGRPSSVVLPFHDGTIEMLRRYRPEFERHAAVAMASEDALDIAVDKERTLAVGESLGIATPRRVSIRCEAELTDAAKEVGFPAVFKPNRSWARHGAGGKRVASALLRSLDELKAHYDKEAELEVTSTLQEWLPGRRDAVTFFVAKGNVKARFAQTSYREFPPLGGASVLCESIPLLDDICEPAERLVKTVGIEGCTMVEFRRDRCDRPVLMELNARIPGSVSLAVNCGVDLPYMTYAWATGSKVHAMKPYQVGKRIRWLGGDFWNLKYAFDVPRGPESPSPGRALADFVLDFVRRPAAIEVFDKSDLVPPLVETHNLVIKPIARRLLRLGRTVITRTAHPALIPLMDTLLLPVA